MLPSPADVHVRFDDSSAARGWHAVPRLGRATRVLWCDPHTVVSSLRSTDGLEREWRDPLEALRWMAHDVRDAGHPPGRWAGYISYDLGRWFEKLPSAARDDLRVPLFVFTFHPDDNEAPAVAERPASGAAQSSAALTSTFSRSAYLRAVQRAIDYIAAGDIFQVNLSQRFTAPMRATPAEVYHRLRAVTPAAHGALLDYGDFALISNSPELFLRVAPDRRVVTRPIKGTRPRSPGMEEELRRSIKDQAELNMIVDLERNDLGRVCEVGSVRVTEPRTIEAHPTVYHGVATVEGVLRDDVDFVDLLRATFPGGSITGAPKIRAMEIIEELEPVRRGPYCGAIGYLSSDGHVEFNIAIRTMIVKDGRVHVPVGGGIVADSVSAAEYEETLVKARAMFAALGLSVDDLRL